MTMDITDYRAALQLVRQTIEEHCPPGVLPSEDYINGRDGPTLLAEALSAAIVATVKRLSFNGTPKPPVPSIKGVDRNKSSSSQLFRQETWSLDLKRYVGAVTSGDFVRSEPIVSANSTFEAARTCRPRRPREA